MGLTKEQYVNAAGYLKIHIARIESSSKILFDENSTLEQKETAKLDSEEAIQKMFILLNTISEKEAYAKPTETYTDQDMAKMKIYSEADIVAMDIKMDAEPAPVK